MRKRYLVTINSDNNDKIKKFRKISKALNKKLGLAKKLVPVSSAGIVNFLLEQVFNGTTPEKIIGFEEQKYLSKIKKQS